MRKRQLTVLSAVATIGFGVTLAASPSAEASPRFTVVNDSKSSITVQIFNGGDVLCDAYTKKKSVSAGETDTFGCTGNGKGHCKVILKTDGHSVCADMANTCNSGALKVKGKSTLKITGEDPNFKCQLN